ncbi:MAG: pantetheine-phosphate adenylyltransferase [Synergistaceae bacterium]|nr:pantetheine-phosphate adenylyltransferase [Synergistaceae bacterium]
MLKAIYPGAFDPITKGHIFIAERAAQHFDEVVMAVLINPDKNPLFSMEERIEMISDALSHCPNVKVCGFDGLLVDFARKTDCSVIIRGLRALSDFEYEFQLAQMNRHLAPECETMFISTDAQYSYISSSAIKTAFQFGGGVKVKEFVPSLVYNRLQEKYSK